MGDVRGAGRPIPASRRRALAQAIARACALCGLAVLASCAARAPVMPPEPTALGHPEFRYPVVPPGADAVQAARIERGWRYLQADNPRVAQREFDAALKQQPSFHPAETGLAYIALAERDAAEAVARFDRALATEPSYTPALIGRGQALLELGRDSDALASFEAAVKTDPGLTDLQGRIEVLRFRALQESLARAKAASDASRLPEARAAYAQAIAASPESAFLYRELALVERKAGELALALDHLRRAVTLDPADARAHVEIGAILEEQQDLAGALAAYEKGRALDPAEVPADRLDRLRDTLALARMPAEYRAIPSSTTATRAEVAAAIGVRLAPLLAKAPPRQAVVTDVRGHWAQPWIMAAVRAGVMDIQPNYTFQPGARVRRGDLAQTVSRVLSLIATAKPAASQAWQAARLKIADLGPGHLNYPAVSQAVAAGVMRLDESGSFQLLRPVTGAEVVEVVGRLEALATP